MREIVSLFLIFATSLLMANFSTFTPSFLLAFMPGFLLSISITLPRIYPKVAWNSKKVHLGLIYLVLWWLSAALMVMFQIVNNSLEDKSPYIILGFISGLAVSILFEIQFGFRNRIVGILTTIVCAIFACLLFDYIHPAPHDKEPNLGHQILIWNVLVGVGITLNSRKSD